MKFLAGDIGGTKTLLALFIKKDQGLEIEREEKFVSKEFDCLEKIIERFLHKEKEQIESAAFGIAGPVRKKIAKTTNLPWTVDEEKIKKAFSIPQVYIMNDLESNAYGLNMLSQDKGLFVLHQKPQDETGNQALVSAGTGLGECPIFYTKKQRVPSASEGGHADFSPRNDQEIQLFKFLQKQYGHVSYERVLSGMGIVNLYSFLIKTGLEKEEKELAELMKKEDPAKVITRKALEGSSPLCIKVVDWFCSLYGAEAGNFALKVFATGGIYLGGGIAPKILPFLKKGAFMEAFCDKGRFSSFMKDIYVAAILDEKAALKGSAYFCFLESFQQSQ